MTVAGRGPGVNIRGILGCELKSARIRVKSLCSTGGKKISPMNLLKNVTGSAARAETLPRGAAILILVASLGVLYFSFTENKDCLLFGLDGAAWRIMLHAQTVYRSLFTYTGVDPFQGSFDAWYPDFPEFLLPSGLGLLLTGSVPGRVMTYFVYGIFLLFAAYTLARTIGFERSVALLGALLLPTLALPGLVHSIAALDGLFDLDPHIAQIVGLSILIVAAFWALGRQKYFPALFLVFVPVLCLMIAILGLVDSVALMVPAVGLYGGASLLDARDWRDDILQLIAGVLMIAVPAALGAIQYVYGLIGYTAYNFFSAEFYQTRGQFAFASSLFGYSSLGRLAIPLGIVGALWVAFTGAGRLRLFALTHLVATSMFLGFAVMVVEFAHSYQGPSPVYFETCFWPYDLLFAGVAILTVLRSLLLLPHVAFNGTAVMATVTSLRSLVLERARRSAVFPRLDVIALAGLLLLVAGFNAVQASRRDELCPAGAFNPIQPTTITDIMKNAIPVVPGKSFNGLAATIYGLRGKPSISWYDFHRFDASIWRHTGNDLRTVGLWQYNIPTLFQYFTFITPPYYLLLTDFLARPQDQQFRSVLVLTRINEAKMRLWGVRFVITDIDSGVGSTRVELPVGNNETVRLIELSNVNVGDYSPTEVKRAADFHDGLAIMHDPTFDGRSIVVTDAAFDGPFVNAANVKLVYEKDGFSLQATSPGRSLLVLPIQYSHCWTISGGGDPSLFRADLMQLGVIFTGNLDARLIFRFGPLFAGRCRIEDLRDMKRLRVDEGRHAS